jgi:hypothetical protein
LIVIFFRGRTVFKNPKGTWTYLHHMKNIVINIKKLMLATGHVEIARIIVSLDESLTYFEKIDMSVFDRPPQQLRRSIKNYVALVIQYIYHIHVIEDNHMTKYLISSIEELEQSSDYQELDEIEKLDIVKRRKEYEDKLHLDELRRKLHSGADLMHILDFQSSKIEREIRRFI